MRHLWVIYGCFPYMNDVIRGFYIQTEKQAQINDVPV